MVFACTYFASMTRAIPYIWIAIVGGVLALFTDWLELKLVINSYLANEIGGYYCMWFWSNFANRQIKYPINKTCRTSNALWTSTLLRGHC